MSKREVGQSVNKKLVFFILLSLTGALAFGQSNARMDDFLSQEKAHAADAAYFVLVGAHLLTEDAESQSAYDAALKASFLRAKLGPDSVIPAEDLAFLIVKAFKIDKSLSFRIFPSPRCAYNELVTLGVMRNNGPSARALSGEETLMVISLSAAYREGGK
jgi:hypothetical protein